MDYGVPTRVIFYEQRQNTTSYFIEVKEWEILSYRGAELRRLGEKHYELISLVIVESGEREAGSGGSKTGVLKLGTTF